MPIYEYRCDCGSYLEVFQGMNDSHTPPICSRCHKRMYRFFTSFTLKVVGGASDQSKIDKEMNLIKKAQTDDTPISKTEQEVAMVQLEKRCDKRGEDFEKTRKEIFEDAKGKKIKDKVEFKGSQRKKALRQRKLIDK